jgi:hypothetical protein
MHEVVNSMSVIKKAARRLEGVGITNDNIFKNYINNNHNSNRYLIWSKPLPECRYIFFERQQ